ncbi:hypothetical protein A5871_002408, partial [Enterococcus sp. 2F9_DIV0599]|uniref:hypothetical protein n=1 Tax=Enterococcus sp. 2F9_DIV0599 TaxID=1834172 RepID=UPI000B73A1AA
MGTYSQNQVIKFITEYKTAYEEISHIKLTVSETHSNFRFVESLKPVSYTHLDVYKRQFKGYLFFISAP